MNPDKTRKTKNIFIILLCAVTLISLGISLFLLFQNNSKPVNNPEVYPSIPVDSSAEKVKEEESPPSLASPEGGGAVSLTYSTQLSAEKGDDMAVMMFQNPARSNQGIVIQLHLTDKEIIEKIGKTGRNSDDKAAIEEAEDYNPETSRIIIAESGLLSPGYKLSSMKLNPLDDGTVLPAGSYSGVYYILAYNNQTNERAIVNMQIPVVLTVTN